MKLRHSLVTGSHKYEAYKGRSCFVILSLVGIFVSQRWYVQHVQGNVFIHLLLQEALQRVKETDALP